MWYNMESVNFLYLKSLHPTLQHVSCLSIVPLLSLYCKWPCWVMGILYCSTVVLLSCCLSASGLLSSLHQHSPSKHLTHRDRLFYLIISQLFCYYVRVFTKILFHTVKIFVFFKIGTLLCINSKMQLQKM